jgi:hypothetical protein
MPQPAAVERFALLVGVNDYAEPSQKEYQISPLKGPGTDVQLIKELLTSQYGFQDDKPHILVLTGKKATHQGIKDAFKSQLIDKSAANPNSVVLFFFSGHGSQADSVSPGDTTQHDTLLAYDSRADGGTDILDNELVDWFEVLRRSTSNITFILDSCHSGSAIKGVTDHVARIAPPNPRQSTVADYSAKDAPPVKAAKEILPRRQQFVLLSGSQADESSFECDTADCAISNGGPTNYGFFTYYLTQALKTRPNETNDEAVRDVGTALAKVSPYQHPQAVGNIEGHVLSGIGERDDPYIPIQSVLAKDQFVILGGAPLGLRKGAFLAVYRPGTRHLTGDDAKLANATVTTVGSVTSTAVLSDRPKEQITTDDRVAIVTPFFGFEPLKIRLVDSPNVADTQINAALASLVQANKLLTLAAPGGPWDIAVKRGCAIGDKVFTATQMSGAARDCQSVYYVTLSQGDQPLFNFFVPTSDSSAAAKLSSNMDAVAKQNNVRALDNASSPFRGQLKIKLIRVDVQTDEAGRPKAVPLSTAVNDGPQSMKIGQNFLIQTENQSTEDLYAAVLVLGSGGAVRLLTANPHGDLLHGGQTSVSHVPWVIGPPLGRETYKVFASMSPTVDYRVIEQPGAQKGISQSPFEWLLNQTTNMQSRDPHASANLNLNDWTTASVDVIIQP